MIGTKREALIDCATPGTSSPHLGGPLGILALVLAMWVGGRAVLWEDPFGVVLTGQALIERLAEVPVKTGADLPNGLSLDRTDAPCFSDEHVVRPVSFADLGPGPSFSALDAQLAAGHHSLWQAALTTDIRQTSWRSRRGFFEAAEETQAKVPVFPGTPPFVARKDAPDQRARADRWSLSSWTFVRSGSTRTRIAPGPAPVYGASQAGAIVRHRLAPQSPTDPKAYLRATRSFVDQPESEVAAGFSLRPLALPARAAVEVRVTDNRLDSDLRPTAFAITEIPPIVLPLGLTGELYAAAGYVGGKADTGFLDGQATLVRNLASFDLTRVDDTRLSVGAGAWGGVQRGVHRVDVGPTVRLDLSLGAVPARVSIDYRERVDGQARPSSGVAATLSTQF